MRFGCAMLLVTLAGSSTGCYRVVAGYGLTPRWEPVAGPGPLTNIGSSSEANTNALGHVTASVAISLFGEIVGGGCGLWAAGLAWMAYSVAEEVGEHASEEHQHGLLTQALHE